MTVLKIGFLPDLPVKIKQEDQEGRKIFSFFGVLPKHDISTAKSLLSHEGTKITKDSFVIFVPSWQNLPFLQWTQDIDKQISSLKIPN
jgi:hypothetical protein